MFTPIAVIGAIGAYMLALFAMAQLGERTHIGKRIAGHPATYALGLAVYCTTWTYYGSVGKAATGGMGYLPVYLGPTLAMLVGGSVFRRIARLKHAHRITSIADFISARYAKSQSVAAVVTLLLTVGIVPYIALQMKAVTSTFAMLTAGAGETGLAGWFGPIVVVAMIVFTIVFGIRHIDPTERHPGMLVSLAAESMMKLVAFLAAGAFVVGAAFSDGSGFWKVLEELPANATPLLGQSSVNDTLTFVTVTLLSMAAFAFLPRQFHVGIVENSDERHVRTAQWMTPLYLIAINLFVLPIALGGKRIAEAGTAADFYVLALPLQAGQHGLSLAVFIGGFSAAIGMIMIESMTMATMISNHVVMPLVQAVRPLHGLRRRMLYVRWVAAAALIIAGYKFAVALGASYPLVAIGLISFAAAFVLAPIALGGLFWKAATRTGALIGLGAGFTTWFYTLLMPTFVKAHWLPQEIITAGPFGIAALKPEALFGWTGLPALAHGVIWSTLATVVAYVVGSLVFAASKEERLLTEAFLGDSADQLAHLDGSNATIDVAELGAKVGAVFAQYFSEHEAREITARELARVVAPDKEKISVVEQAELLAGVERVLAGAIGAASAHGAMRQFGTVDRKDKKALEREFARTLAALRISPKELRQRIDYQKDREALLETQFHELEAKVQERDNEIVERKKAEEALQVAHDDLEARVIERTKELRAILDNVVFGFLVIDENLVVQDGFTQSCHELLVTDRIAGRQLGELLGLDSSDMLRMGVGQVFEDMLPEALNVEQLPHRFPMPNGRTLNVDARAVRDGEGKIGALLMTISDVTVLEAAQHENEDNRALLNILRQKPAFESFLSETKAQLHSARDANSDADVTHIRRVAHTIKGNISLYGLGAIARLIHEIEEQPRIEGEHIDAITHALREYLTAHRSVLGINFDQEQHRVFTLSEEQLQELRSIQAGLEPAARVQLDRLLRELALSPVSDLLGPVQPLVELLGARLDKDVRVNVSGTDVRVDARRLAPLFQTLPHFIRNAIDHGIEARGQRGMKPACARLMIAVSETPRDYVVVVEDDGRGIDAEAVVRAAVARGVVSAQQAKKMSTDAKVMLIFADEVSTATEVTDVSGRGVGMSAARAECERLGGKVTVQSRIGEGTRIEMCIPKVARLSVPPRQDAPVARRAAG